MIKNMLRGAVIALVGMAAVTGGAGTAEADDRPIVRPCFHKFENGSKRIYCGVRKVEKREVINATRYGQIHEVGTKRAPRFLVTLNNGALFDLIGCRLEDSRNCYWDAKRMGNHRGKSFANIRGKVVYLHKPTKADLIPRPPITGQ